MSTAIQTVAYSASNYTAVAASCPAGYVCLAGNTSSTPCPAGTYQPSIGATSLSACLNSPAGYFVPVAGSAAFIAVPPGYMSSQKAISPTICSAGTYSAGGASACTACPSGYQCPTAGMSAPLQCAAGTYASGGTACLTCPRGSYCPDGIAVTACAAGTYDDSPGGRSFQCLQCPSGSYCSTPTTVSTCPAGNYCPALSSTPTPCPAGTLRTGTGGSSLGDCGPCVAGSWCAAGATTPTACGLGTFLAATNGASATACASCPVGSFCAAGGLQALCQPGTYQSATGASVCASCASGTFDASTIGRSSACPACPGNSYCTTPLLQLACPSNTVSASGSNSQLGCRCVAGYACSYTKRITATITLANVSAANFTANVGNVRTNLINAVAAAAGVPALQVTIGSVTPHAGRRLLHVQLGGAEKHLSVHVSIEGAHKLDLAHLKQQLAAVKNSLWQPQHAVNVRRVAAVLENNHKQM